MCTRGSCARNEALSLFRALGSGGFFKGLNAAVVETIPVCPSTVYVVSRGVRAKRMVSAHSGGITSLTCNLEESSVTRCASRKNPTARGWIRASRDCMSPDSKACSNPLWTIFRPSTWGVCPPAAQVKQSTAAPRIALFLVTSFSSSLILSWLPLFETRGTWNPELSFLPHCKGRVSRIDPPN